jgi:hypothetical protein
MLGNSRLGEPCSANALSLSAVRAAAVPEVPTMSGSASVCAVS